MHASLLPPQHLGPSRARCRRAPAPHPIRADPRQRTSSTNPPRTAISHARRPPPPPPARPGPRPGLGHRALRSPVSHAVSRSGPDRGSRPAGSSASPGSGDPGGRSGAHRVGVELEWLAVRLDRPRAARSAFDASAGRRGEPRAPARGEPDHLRARRPGRAQLPRRAGLGGLRRPVPRRRHRAHRGPAAAGVALVAVGLEPGGARERVVRNARYDAMEVVLRRATAPPGGR